MKICMFTNTYRPHVGGVANSVATFAEDRRRIGHRVLIVAPEFDNEPPEKAAGDEVDTEMDPLESLLQRIRTEWDLVENKLSAVIQTFNDSAEPE